eukprot:s951_g11.t1
MAWSASFNEAQRVESKVRFATHGKPMKLIPHIFGSGVPLETHTTHTCVLCRQMAADEEVKETVQVSKKQASQLIAGPAGKIEQRLPASKLD